MNVILAVILPSGSRPESVCPVCSKEDKALYLLPQYTELVRIATSSDLCVNRALVLSILFELPASHEPDSDLLDFCLTHLSDMKESDSSRSVMIKLAARMCKSYPDLCKELMLYLSLLPQGVSPGIAAAKRNALKMISSAAVGKAETDKELLA